VARRAAAEDSAAGRDFSRRRRCRHGTAAGRAGGAERVGPFDGPAHPRWLDRRAHRGWVHPICTHGGM